MFSTQLFMRQKNLCTFDEKQGERNARNTVVKCRNSLNPSLKWNIYFSLFDLIFFRLVFIPSSNTVEMHDPFQISRKAVLSSLTSHSALTVKKLVRVLTHFLNSPSATRLPQVFQGVAKDIAVLRAIRTQ